MRAPAFTLLVAHTRLWRAWHVTQLLPKYPVRMLSWLQDAPPAKKVRVRSSPQRGFDETIGSGDGRGE